MKARLPVAAALAVLLAAGGAAAFDEELKVLPTRPGVTLAVLLVKPAGPPAASMILFAGGHGRLSLSPQGIGWGRGNFLVRSRSLFAERGFLVALVDAPSDQMTHGLWHFRTTEAHAQDAAAVIAYLKQAGPAPVWLVGTSAGTLSAANAAARLPSGPDGVVLTSSITRATRNLPYSLRDVDLAAITVSTLFVHHKDDGCVATPYDDLPGVMKRLKKARRAELLTFSGGDPPRSDACEPLSPHGFLGIERAVVGQIAAWIRATSDLK